MTKLKPDLAKKLLPTKLGNSDNIEIDHYDRLRHSVMIIADKQRLDPIRDQIELLEIINNIVNQEISNNAIAGANTIIDFEATTTRLSNSIFGYGRQRPARIVTSLRDY